MNTRFHAIHRVGLVGLSGLLCLLFVVGSSVPCAATAPAAASLDGVYRAVFYEPLGGGETDAVFTVQRGSVIHLEVKSAAGTITVAPPELSSSIDQHGIAQITAKVEATESVTLEGSLPAEGHDGTIALTRTVTTPGGTNRTRLNGVVTHDSLPIGAPDASRLSDTGTTRLVFSGASILFDHEWRDAVVFVTETKAGDVTRRRLDLESKTGDAERSLQLSVVSAPGKTSWQSDEGIETAYHESAGGKRTSWKKCRAGRVEIVSQSEHEIVWKITDLEIQRLFAQEYVRIDGFVHAKR